MRQEGRRRGRPALGEEITTDTETQRTDKDEEKRMKKKISTARPAGRPSTYFTAYSNRRERANPQMASRWETQMKSFIRRGNTRRRKRLRSVGGEKGLVRGSGCHGRDAWRQGARVEKG